MSPKRSRKPKTSGAPAPLRMLAEQLREAADKYAAVVAEMRATEKQALAEAADHVERGEENQASAKRSQAGQCRFKRTRSMKTAGARVGRIIRQLAVHDGFPGVDLLRAVLACAEPRGWHEKDATGADFMIFSGVASGLGLGNRDAERGRRAKAAAAIKGASDQAARDRAIEQANAAAAPVIESWSKTHTPEVRREPAYGEEATARWFVDFVGAMADVVDEHAERVGEQADDATGPDLMPTPLTVSEVTTLLALRDIGPHCLATVDKVTVQAKDLGETTVKMSIRRLIELGLAERPHGDRLGTRITAKGREAASKFAHN